MQLFLKQRCIVLLLPFFFIFPLHSQGADSKEKVAYPSEPMTERLNRIARDFKADIAFDSRSMEGISLPIQEKSNTVEQALERSLANTGFTYRKNEEKSFSIINQSGEQHKQPTKGTGKLKGRVVENETSEPLIGAAVRIVGTNLGSMTNLDGYYNFENVPAGHHIIEVNYMGYTTQQVQVNISPSRTATYDVILSVDSKLLDEVVISGIRRERGSVPHATVGQVTQEIKELKVVASGISSEQISKSADRNAAQAVSKVAGVSIVDDKFVIVRGLNPRYNLTYLNDNVAPSTEANSRSFALDLIPSRVIDKILVQKSPSPDVQADATGGVVKIYTKDARAVKHFDIDLQLGYRTGTTFNSNFMTYKGGKTDFLGFDDGTRALPSSVPGYGSLVKANLRPSEYAKAMNPTLTYGKKRALPNIQITANYYDAWMLFGNTLSSLTSLSYKNDNIHNNIYRQQGNAHQSAGSTDKMSDESRSTNNVQTNLLQNFTYTFNKDHVLFFKNFFLLQGADATVNRISQKTTNLLWNESHERDMDITLSYNQRFLYAGNLGGTHAFNNARHEVKWNGGYAFSQQDIPDQRVIRLTGINPEVVVGDESLQWRARGYYPSSSDDPQITERALGIISRIWSRNSEGVYNGSLDYSYKITSWLTAKTGTFLQWKSRTMDRRIFTAHEANIKDPGVNKISQRDYVNPIFARFRLQDLPYVWSETFLNDEFTGLQMHDRTSGSDTYRGTEQNNSGYLLLNVVPENRIVEIYGGLRYEYNRQRIAAAVPTSNSTKELNIPILVDNPTHSWLPSVSLTFRPTEQWVLRASYGKTVNRTEFREVSPFRELDFENNIELRGNPDLLSASVENYDLRLEFYPKGDKGDILSAGVFFKDIRHPIERINTSNRVESMFPSISYSNASSATVKGLEIELRKSFDFIPLAFFRNLSFAGNVSIIESKTQFNDIDKEIFNVTERPLQGQAPYLVNAGLYYENAGWGSKLGVIYNTSGESIYAAGRGYIYNSFVDGPTYRGSLIELPRHLLDLSYTQRIGKGLQLKLTVQNILDEALTIIEDNNYTNKYEKQHDPVELEADSHGRVRMDYGDNISSRYKPGRYFSLSVSHSF